LNIKNNILILGYIPKNDQLAVLKNCIAVIQPTLFEGGPGGGAVYEAVGYGIPSIVSDISVNREINDETVIFFKAGSPDDLAEKMRVVYENPPNKYSNKELVDKNNKLLLKFGTEILNIFNNYNNSN
jgi:glycosyltransferase involved in cell wall biosynthesis